MMVQAQEEMGKGLVNPMDPHDTPTIIQSLISQPQKTQKHRKPRRKVTEVPQPSDPLEHVVDEAVNEEMYDSLEMVTTTATSLDAEHDRGIILKTQSKATPNEPGSQGTSSGGGLSGEDSLKLNELMELCTKLQQMVLDLETSKTTQALEIDSLKKRVKKLERRKRSRTHKLKRLYKVGLSTRVESSKDEGLGEKDASKQGRIADIDVNEDIYLVNVHNDEQMLDADQDLHGEEVFVVKQDENVVVKKVDAAQVQVSTATTTPTILSDEATLAQALAELKHAKPKANAKGIVFHEPKELQAEEQKELSDEENATLFMQLLKKRRKFFAAKRAEEKRNKPPTQAQQIKIMCTFLKNMEGKKLTDLKNKSFDSIQKMFDRAFKRANTFVDFITEVVEKSSKKAEAEDFDIKDVETLWKLVKDKHGSTRPEGDYKRVLWGDLKVMFEPHIEDEVWKMQQIYKVEFYITRHSTPSDRRAVRSHMKILSVASLKTFSKYGNTYLKEIVLRRADFQDYEISEDYTIVHKPRPVIYRDRNNQKKMMRETKVHKFSDDMLTKILEKLDDMVKDFRLFKFNPGMENRIWSEGDKKRSKEFIEVIKRRLKIRRISRNLESFVSGRLRDVDYRLIQRTE
nr:hypothetical protein [Tanacetum cinerariifolium]